MASKEWIIIKFYLKKFTTKLNHFEEKFFDPETNPLVKIKDKYPIQRFDCKMMMFDGFVEILYTPHVCVELFEY